MNSPRKYASPYLTGLPGLPSSEVVKSKKKSKTSTATLSESAAAVKQIQDGIWQNARAVSSKTTTGTTKISPSETSFDDASTSGGIVVNKFFSEIDNACDATASAEEDFSVNKVETEIQQNDNIPELEPEETQLAGEDFQVTEKDSILMDPVCFENSTNTDEENIPSWCATAQDKYDDGAKKVEKQTQLKSILKHSCVITNDKLKGGKHLESENVGKNPNRKHSVRSKSGTPREENFHIAGATSSLKGTRRSTPNLDVQNRLNTKTRGKIPKSPRKNSKSLGNTSSKMLPQSNHSAHCGPEKAVTFSNRVEVHTVPYEPRAGSKACDWQRNLLEQRVQTFRKLMTEVSGTNDVEIFGNALLFGGYPCPSYLYQPPNPNFALREDGSHRFGNILGMPGTIGTKRNFKS